MKTGRRHWIGFALLAAALLALSVAGMGCASKSTTTTAASVATTGGGVTTETTAPPAAAAEHLKIGLIEPMSGPISVVGLAFKRGYELYADKVNAEGGLQVGDKKYLLDILSEDGKGSPEASGTAAKKLVLQDGATFVAGEILEPASDAIYQVTSTAPNKVMHILSWVNVPFTPSDVSAKKPLQVRLAISPQDTDLPDMEYLVKTYPQAKKIAIVYPNIGYDPLIVDVTAIAKDKGLEVVGSFPWEFGTTDFVPVYSKALATKPDVIVALVSAQADAQLRAARDLGYKGVFISTSPLAPEFFVKTAGNAACTDVIVNGMDMTHPTPEMAAVKDASMKKYNDFASDELVGYDQIWTLAQLMQKAGSVDPAKVDAVLDQMTADGSLQTTYGPGRIGGAKAKYGVNRVLYRPLSVVRLMNGA
ncbi:MAG: ABC transporter substrate-binding protein, partial [Actinobacteria bacterium]|nr:ABC transporter substrate-binding protein [Actinomycetota bacterium]